MTKFPFGIKYIRFINYLAALWVVVVGLLFGAIAASNFIVAAEGKGKTIGGVDVTLAIAIGLAYVASAVGFAIILLLINRQLRQPHKLVFQWQIIVSCIFLLFFPVGTVLYGIAFYFLLIDPTTKKVFQEVVPA